MGPTEGRGRSGSGSGSGSRSPLIRRPDGWPPTPPNVHTEAELACLITMLTEARSPDRPPIRSVAVGHGRDDASRAAARAFVEAWQPAHGAVLAVVDWPEDAASWLRQARRLTAGAPDAWVVAGAARGWGQLSRRLLHSTDWRPDRTFAFASIGDAAAVGPAVADILDGLRGASADGGGWCLAGGLITRHEPSGRPGLNRADLG
ncbi:hypothetical protein [Kitasatospora sp. NPDC057198]|uniref:hypothetical protein n=1 Tax=Kitasatospora sp. NPDC057198 TaxID=3346046 RepID=UPI0036435AD6